MRKVLLSIPNQLALIQEYEEGHHWSALGLITGKLPPHYIVQQCPDEDVSVFCMGAREAIRDCHERGLIR